MIYQNNQQTQVEQNVEDKLNLVHEKENAAEDTDANVSAQGKLNADMDGNGQPDGDDVVMILKKIAKLI